MRTNKYSALPDKDIALFRSTNTSLILSFEQPDGREQVIDLTFFIKGDSPRPQIAKACAEVFWLNLKGYSSSSRTAFCLHLKTFNKFLNWRGKAEGLTKIETTLDFDSSLFIEFKAYLDIIDKKNKEITPFTKYHCIKRFFSLMQASCPEYLRADLTIPPNPFSQKSGKGSPTGNILNFEDLRLIAEAATKEVKEIMENHKQILKRLEEGGMIDAQSGGKKKPSGFWKSLSNVIYYMIRVRGILSKWDDIYGSLYAYKHPRPSTIISWYTPTSERQFIPFLILLFLKTAINVTSIFNLRRDCLEEHPLPLGLTILKFAKPRAGAHMNKELYFPTRQKGGVVDLIHFLLEYTQPWVEYASKAEKRSLFLYYSRAKGVRAAGNYFTQDSLRRFIKRNNLPHFTFDQLRPTVATLLYLQTRDIFRVQRALNHTNVKTTVLYIKGIVVRARHDQEMARGIDEMVKGVTGINPHEGNISLFLESPEKVITAKVENEELTAEAGEKILNGGCNTLVGRCRDPLNSPQPGEIKGRVCRSLHSCLFCDNCWIFAEDLPAVIRYRNSLEAEKTEMTSEVWDLLHGEAVREINKSILTAFPSEIVAQAELEAKNKDLASCIANS